MTEYQDTPANPAEYLPQSSDPIADEALASGEADGWQQADEWLRKQSVTSLRALAEAATSGMSAVDPTIPSMVLGEARQVLLQRAMTELGRLF